MYIKAVDAKDGSTLFNCGVEGIMPTPATGDIFVSPDGVQLRVLQRAFIAREVKGPLDASNLRLTSQQPSMLDFEVQLAVCPLGQEQLYTGGNANAGS